MDDPEIPAALLHKNLRELDMLNRYLGGHAISLAGIKKLMTDRSKLYHIVDLGCGSGDVLKYIARWARKNQFQVKLTGVDNNPQAIKYLEANSLEYPEISGVAANYTYFLETATEVDIVHCALFCHHLEDETLYELFSSLKARARIGFVINDLQRNPLAYYSVWLLTRLLNGSALSKHDGPVSVQRAFKRNEIAGLLQKAGIKTYSIRWKWIFRYLVVVKNFNKSVY